MIFGLIFWYALLCLLLALAIFFASYLLVCPELSAGKLSAYECGFEPYGDARFAFDVRFYLIAILFLVFDLEISFLIPWVVSLKGVGAFGFSLMLIFLCVVTVGFIYEWLKGALEWE